MVVVKNFAALLKEAADWVNEEPVTALYPCCGQDTMPFTFTHPDFFKHLDMQDIPSPNVFIFIDKIEHHLEYDDANLSIAVVRKEDISIFGHNAAFHQLVWSSSADREWLIQKERNFFVVYLVGNWRRFPHVFSQEGFVPDFFVGVTDGCRLGGNPECVNRLSTNGLGYEEAARIPMPRYYITDHFENAQIPNPCRRGDFVSSMDESFPLVFKKLALLSTDWGNYGGWTNLGGATLFKVFPTASC